jgi:hypothetical protein
LTNDDVISLKRAGLSDDLILLKIKSGQTKFRTDPADLVVLKNAGISDVVIAAILSSPSPENSWQLRVNSTYEDAMKTFMGLVTASLVLPLFLIRNFLNVKEGESISDYLQPSAYWSWRLMFLSLLCCMAFFYASAKYVKVFSGGTEKWGAVVVLAGSFETLRDLSIIGSVLSFLAALVFLWRYFAHDIRKA